ncbi:MAG: c-type cytochrome domain-containing protein [Acidobacteriota bacterium]
MTCGLALFNWSPTGLAQEGEKRGTEEVSYLRDVWPVIQRRCQGCHQPAVKLGNLDLTRYESFQAGGKSGPAFVAGDPDGSLLMALITGRREPRMPMGQDPLDQSQIELFREWIRKGAKDDTPAEVKRVTASTEPPVYRQAPVITALAYSPDGSLLAISGYREVILHQSDGSGIVGRLLGVSDRIQSVDFTPDGKTLVAAGGSPARFGELQVWDVETRKLKRSVTVCNDTLFGASISPDGNKVAFGCSDQTLRVHELETGKELLKVGHHENWVLGTVFGIDGKRIVSVGRDYAAKLTDAESGAFIENLNLLRKELAAVARNPLRDAVVVGGEDRVPYYYMMDRIKKMVIADESTLIREFPRQEGEIFAVAFSPDGNRLAVAGAGHEVPIYQVDSGARIAACRGNAAGIYAVAFHPDSQHLATAGFEGRVRIYAADTGEIVKEFVPVPLEGTLTASGKPEER